ncbi:hypothetical protein ACFC6L_19790 [Kitasatospora phosalacinea]|uniref:hypothetical protein n=1 Tax=Kitasatospora phosalacinea TaxID=2065 RepID=UPI0035E0A6D8
MTGVQLAPGGLLGAPQQSGWQKYRLLRTAVLTVGGAVLLLSGCRTRWKRGRSTGGRCCG